MQYRAQYGHMDNVNDINAMENKNSCHSTIKITLKGKLR